MNRINCQGRQQEKLRTRCGAWHDKQTSSRCILTIPNSFNLAPERSRASESVVPLSLRDVLINDKI